MNSKTTYKLYEFKLFIFFIIHENITLNIIRKKSFNFNKNYQCIKTRFIKKKLKTHAHSVPNEK